MVQPNRRNIMIARLSEIDHKVLAEASNLLSKKAKIQQQIEVKRAEFEQSLKPLERTMDELIQKIDRLEVGLTPQSNGHSMIREVKNTKKKKGTPRGATKAKVVDFLKENPNGVTQAQIAKETGIAPAYVNYLLADKKVFSKKAGRGGMVKLKEKKFKRVK